MWKNEILNEKYRVQQDFSKKVQYSLLKYSDLIHQKVLEAEQKNKICFQYQLPLF